MTNSPKTRVLVIEDEPAHLELISHAFRPHDGTYEVALAGTVAEGHEKLRIFSPDILIADLKLPDGLGTSFLDPADDSRPFPLIIMTAQGNETEAVSALKKGAADYIVKSPDILHDLPHIVDRTLRDWRHILEHRQALIELKASEERYRELFKNANDLLFVNHITNKSTLGPFSEVNQSACRCLGYSEAELRRHSLDTIMVGNSPKRRLSRVLESLQREGHALMETTLRCQDGAETDVEINMRLFAIDSQPTVLSIARDITDRKRVEERINHLAYHDQLTGLANRRRLIDRLSSSISNCKRGDSRLAVLFMDLDGFKEINDEYGHEIGDMFLIALAKRMRALDLFGHSDNVARFGGDEFYFLLSKITDTADAENAARRMLQEVSRPVQCDGRKLQVTASIGISLFPDHGSTTHQLIKTSDISMYSAKDQGKNAYVVYKPSLSAG